MNHNLFFCLKLLMQKDPLIQRMFKYFCSHRCCLPSGGDVFQQNLLLSEFVLCIVYFPIDWLSWKWSLNIVTVTLKLKQYVEILYVWIEKNISFSFFEEHQPWANNKRILFFFLRKTGPELTSMPIFLYIICGMPITAWLDEQCHVRTWIRNGRLRAGKAEHVHLTATPPGRSQNISDKITLMLKTIRKISQGTHITRQKYYQVSHKT